MKSKFKLISYVKIIINISTGCEKFATKPLNIVSTILLHFLLD